MSNKIKFCKVNDSDWDFLLKIRNETKEFHQNTSSFTKSKYKKYIDTQLNQNGKNRHWVILVEKKRIGHAKIIDRKIGYILSPEFRQKNMMKFVFRHFELESQKLGYKFILQNIKTNNPISVWSSIKNDWIMIGLEINPSLNLSHYKFKKDIKFKKS
jgi:hypothetical protein